MRKAILTLPLFVVVALVPAQPPPPVEHYTPDALLVLAAADLTSKPLPRTTRYISLDDLPDEKTRSIWQQVISGHIQTLSSEPGIVTLERVGPLLRIDTLECGKVFAEQWEKLGSVEPFWHGEDFSVEDRYEEKEYGYWVDELGNQYQDKAPGRKWKTTETRKVKVESGKAVRGLFVRTTEGKGALETIAIKTGGTDVPVVRATWFLAQTAINWQRGELGYYGFTGIKDLKTYEQVIGFVRKGQSEAFLRDVRAGIGRSGVTTPDTLRRVIRFDAPTGGYYITQDSDQRVAKDKAKSNPIVNLGDDYEFQAIETIGYGANRFPKTGLFDQDGKIQDRAPDNIAGNKHGTGNDHRIHVNLSCQDCHCRAKKAYLQDVDDWVRSDLNVDGLLGTKLGEKKARDLRSQYVVQYLEPHLERDRRNFEVALWQATKMKPDEYATAYTSAYRSASEEDVTIDAAARQLGVTPAETVKAFAAQGEKLDIALVPLRNKKPRAIPSFVWQNSFQRAADAVHGTSRPYKVRKEK